MDFIIIHNNYTKYISDYINCHSLYYFLEIHECYVQVLNDMNPIKIEFLSPYSINAFFKNNLENCNLI